jgi:beta-glucanase (GH16 family)
MRTASCSPSYEKKLVLIVGLLLLSACSMLASDNVKQTPTRPTQSTPEGEGIYWDLVFISDSSGWYAGSKYAKYIEADLGVSVRLHDFSIGGYKALAP